MKKTYLLLFAVFLLAACNGKGPKKTLTEQRAETDTTLVFQGIRIGEQLDSVHYSEFLKSFPVKLYDEDKKSFLLTDVAINDEDGFFSPGDVVHSLCMMGRIEKYWDFLSFICLYEESYDCFSYFLRVNQAGERMGSLTVGEKSELSGKAWTRMDAIDDLLRFGESEEYTFYYVWEWNNQSIALSFHPGDSPLNVSVTYTDEGFAARQAEKEAQQRQKDSKDREIEKARKRQQI